MSRRAKTGFDRYFDDRMKNREFAGEYVAARREIDTIDGLVQALDQAREQEGLTKAELAKRVGMKAEVVRRLFTAHDPNPTLDTVVKLVSALNCSLDLVPRARAVRR
jgi:DNA-binding phage protein